MIKVIQGHTGFVVDIETEEDALDALGLIIEQLKALDEGHPFLDGLEEQYGQMQEDLA